MLRLYLPVCHLVYAAEAARTPGHAANVASKRKTWTNKFSRRATPPECDGANGLYG